ncbi:hypothetical protein NG798_25015 [Ancylothrix sp. C2]|uniref:hypothetical protein n=1 Tax=Ancylothrix sp. D3o TaxID=2953691 RepID=UPI0021BAF2B5|nr:hypothetical protein [Ancylothrix sp. D3o]MCT7953063.1 hypothetical protein [Ancylothrix sp. D3o]
MTQPSMSEQEQRELAELLELAKLTEQRAKELCDLTLEIDQKYEKRFAQLKVAEKLKRAGLS